MKNAPVGHIAGANFFRMADYNMCVLIIGQVTLPAHKKKNIVEQSSYQKWMRDDEIK